VIAYTGIGFIRKDQLVLLKVLKSKIHRATVTDANLEYEGSITLDQSLMEAAGFREYEKVAIWNVTNGNRLSTYVMTPAPPGSGVVCINGSAAHKCQKGDVVILACFVSMTEEEYKDHKPIKIYMSENNQIKKIT
jgi:aspartate 1-decarboxylase